MVTRRTRSAALDFFGFIVHEGAAWIGRHMPVVVKELLVALKEDGVSGAEAHYHTDENLDGEGHGGKHEDVTKEGLDTWGQHSCQYPYCNQRVEFGKGSRTMHQGDSKAKGLWVPIAALGRTMSSLGLANDALTSLGDTLDEDGHEEDAHHGTSHLASRIEGPAGEVQIQARISRLQRGAEAWRGEGKTWQRHPVESWKYTHLPCT